MNQAVQSAGHVFVEAEAVLPDVKRLLEMSQRIDIPFARYFPGNYCACRGRETIC